VKTIQNPSTTTSAVAWEQFGIAPTASHHGSGLPFAGTAAAQAPTYAPMTLAGRRDDAAKVPDPRGRKR
jgi:hypothetical protein